MSWETGVVAGVSGLLAVLVVVLGREIIRLRDRVNRLEIMRERNGLK